jgi:hypothetical protein
MPVPTDPYNFVTDTIADADQVDARFAPLYEALDGALDESNMAVPKGTFAAHRATALAVVSNPQSIVLDGESIDTSGWFDTATGLFTPQVAGYYRFSWGALVAAATGAGHLMVAQLAKNGAVIQAGNAAYSQAALPYSSTGSFVAQANGSTDSFGVILGGVIGETLATVSTFLCGELIGPSA